MKKTANKAAITLVALFLIGLGIVGLVLPLAPGILFIFVGLYILTLQFAFAERIMRRVVRIHPQVEKGWNHADRTVQGWNHRLNGKKGSQ